MATDLMERIRNNYDKLMFTVAWKILGNREDAEDAVQESYLELHRHRLRLLDPESAAARAYVLAVIESRAVNLYHKRKRERTLPLEELRERPVPLLERDTDLTVCLKKLKVEERQLLLLKYEHGYTIREIAELLGMTEAAAYKIHQRAKDKLERLYTSQQGGIGFAASAGGYGVQRAPIRPIDPDDPPPAFDLEEVFQKTLEW